MDGEQCDSTPLDIPALPAKYVGLGCEAQIKVVCPQLASLCEFSYVRFPDLCYVLLLNWLLWNEHLEKDSVSAFTVAAATLCSEMHKMSGRARQPFSLSASDLPAPR